VLDALNSERFANCSPRQTYVPRVKQDESSASIRMRVMALRQRWRA
jgi:hypothetical protein